jgi:hypothetical protein
MNGKFARLMDNGDYVVNAETILEVGLMELNPMVGLGKTNQIIPSNQIHRYCMTY